MASREELIDRLEKATGPDRELDREVVMIFSPQLRGLPMDERGRWVHPLDGPIYAENLTGSLDEAIALVERVLPGWRLSHIGESTEHDNSFVYTGGWSARLHCTTKGTLYNLSYGRGATPAIALLIALLRSPTPEGGAK